MTSDKQTKSWWSTLPGLLTAVGTAIAAVATLVATLHAIGMFGTKASAAHPDADQSPNPSVDTPRSAGAPPPVKPVYQERIHERIKDSFATKLKGIWEGTVLYRGGDGSLRIQLDFTPCESANCYVIVKNLEPAEGGLLSDRLKAKFNNGLVTFDQPNGPAIASPTISCARSFSQYGSTYQLSFDSNGTLSGPIKSHSHEHASETCAQVSLTR